MGGCARSLSSMIMVRLNANLVGWCFELVTKKGKAKPRGELVECPCCQGTGAQRIFTFRELQDLMQWHDGELRISFVLGGKKYKIHLHLEELKETDRDG